MARFLVGFDGSPASRRALAKAADRAKGESHELVLLTVIPGGVRARSFSDMLPAGLALPPEMSGTFEESARRRLDEVLGALKASGASARGEVRHGETAKTLLAFATEVDANEIFIGENSVEGAVGKVGHNAAAIRKDAPVPVTVVP